MKPPVAAPAFFGYFSGNLEQVFPSRFITSGDILPPSPVITSMDEDVGGVVVAVVIVVQQLISRVKKKCPTSSEASLKKHFCHFVSQVDSFVITSLATGLALIVKNKNHSSDRTFRRPAILEFNNFSI